LRHQGLEIINLCTSSGIAALSMKLELGSKLDPSGIKPPPYSYYSKTVDSSSSLRPKCDYIGAKYSVIRPMVGYRYCIVRSRNHGYRGLLEWIPCGNLSGKIVGSLLVFDKLVAQDSWELRSVL
jgi:hypothetical protein